MRTSIGRVIVAPMPTAAPLIAAMTGLRSAANASDATPPRSRGTPPIDWLSGPSGRFSIRPLSNVPAPPLRSAPTQNAAPAPVTSTTRTASSASAAAQIRASSSAIVPVKALRRSGRSSVTVATPSATW
jgi:hypothetical protein